MPIGYRPRFRFTFQTLLLAVAGTFGALRAAPVLVAIFDGEGYEQASSSAVLVPAEFVFATGVEFGGSVSGVNVTVTPPGRSPLTVPPDDATSFFVERTFPTRAALDAAFPEGRYVVSTSGSQAGSFPLDLAGRKPVPARLRSDNFYPDEALFPGRLVVDWTGPGPVDGGVAFTQVQILTEAEDVVASSPDFDPGMGSGPSGTWVFQGIPRAETYIGQIIHTFMVFNQQGATELMVGRSAVTRFRIRRLPPPDRTTPQILAVTPRADERAVDGSGPITLVFDKPMDRSSRLKLDVRRYTRFFTSSEIVREVGETTWSADGQTATVRFVPPLPTGFYAIEPGFWFKDTAGNAPQVGEHPFVVGTPPPWIISSPTGPVAAPGATVTYSVIAKGPDLAYQWFRDGQPVVGATSAVWRPVADWQSFNAPQVEVEVSNSGGRDRPRALTFSTTVPPADYPLLSNLSIRNRAGSGDRSLVTGFFISGTATNLPLLLRGVGPGLRPFGVTDTLTDPQLRVQPAGSSVATLADDFDGNSTLATAAASVGAFALAAPSKDAMLMYTAAPGGHTAIIATGDGREGIALAEIYRTTPPPANTIGPVLSNVSARAFSGVGADALIAGFTVSPSRFRKGLLIRGVGPGLVPFGVSGVLADPKIIIFRGGETTPLAQNDNWERQSESSLPVAPFAQALGAFSLPPGSKDASLIVYLNSGNYTVQVVGAEGGTGVALIEIYEL